MLPYYSRVVKEFIENAAESVQPCASLPFMVNQASQFLLGISRLLQQSIIVFFQIDHFSFSSAFRC
jgi:hypothetical protein